MTALVMGAAFWLVQELMLCAKKLVQPYEMTRQLIVVFWLEEDIHYWPK